MWAVYTVRGVFRRSGGRRDAVFRLTRAWMIVVFLVLLGGFVTKTTDEYSRLVLGGWVVFALALQVGCYLAFEALNRRYYHSVREPVRTLVIGSGRLAKHLVDAISGNRWLPDSVVGIVDNSSEGRLRWDRGRCPVLGRTSDIEQIVSEHRIRRVYIAIPLESSDMLAPIYRKLVDSNIDVIWAPDIFSLPLINHGSREVAGVPLLTLSESPMSAEGRLIAKSAVDFFGAAFLIMLLSPVMAAAALAVKLSSPGPVIFRQQRHGWDGRLIEVWKFRSMYVHQEDDDTVTQATRSDPRVTPVGRFLRRTSLDELPQLFNVLGGSMSLVGPRPHAVQHNHYYSERIGSYMTRHRLKPGITGLAQVNGFRGETADVSLMAQRVKYDLEYINRWSVWLDIEILLRTPLSLLSRNVY
jgi:putative colanic acid biosynthesis UDP-glucose lipid carrier transferase